MQNRGKIGEFQTLGSAIEASQIYSEELLSGFGFLQERVSSMRMPKATVNF